MNKINPKKWYCQTNSKWSRKNQSRAILHAAHNPLQSESDSFLSFL